MNKNEVLQAMSFGEYVAEEEDDNLESYFVETSQWQKVFAGEIDIVYGAKGSGKSAICSLLLKRKGMLFEKRTLIAEAENPRGDLAFKDLDQNMSEFDLRRIWKLYFLSLVGSLLREHKITHGKASHLVNALEEAKLLKKEQSLRSLLRSVIDYVRTLLKVESVEASLNIDPATNSISGWSSKITLREPSTDQRELGIRSADEWLQLANEALKEANYTVWLVIDRLDVAFADSETLEGNALRALFRVYRDLGSYSKISLKIFLRIDIWKRILNEGFREASHITKSLTISWDKDTLLNLVIRRILKNKTLCNFYSVNEKEVLADVTLQENLFYQIFPSQVNSGRKQSKTFEWMLKRTCDATDETTPRELIYLLSCVRESQLRYMEIGKGKLELEQLFERSALREALPEVSRYRLEQTIYSEYPALKVWIQKLEGEKIEQSIDTLTFIWKCDLDQATDIANKLKDIGFFRKDGSKEKPKFVVPLLYKAALNMVQGSAISGAKDDKPAYIDNLTERRNKGMAYRKRENSDTNEQLKFNFQGDS